MIKIGMLGCGIIANRHLQALKSLQERFALEVTALSDITQGALDQALRIWPKARTYLNARELIACEDINILYICLPSYLHTEYAVLAMQNKINLFIEKPVCLTSLEAQLLLDEQKKNKVFAAVGQVLRFYDEYVFLHNLIRTSEYGKLKLLILKRFCSRAEAWFQDVSKSGGVVLDLHIHDADFVRYAVGEPLIKRVAGRVGDTGSRTHIISEYTCGDTWIQAEGMWNISQAMPFEAGYRAYFEKASVIYNSVSSKEPMIYEKNHAAKWKREDPPREPYQHENEYVLSCLIQKKKPDRISLEEGIKSVRLCRKELSLAKQFINSEH